MDKEKLYQLKNEATKIKPIINIGKNGITDSVLEEIKKQVKANRLIKVKMLKTSAEGENIKTSAAKLAEATKTTLVDVRGSTVVLYR
ncbi:MAG: RNA-binding protein [Methanolobus sp.]|jgi:RNA-binding protein|uniref:Putative RNA-binding protein containing KH domain, possibly ribosomal protein n=1 Tax=Methanolobus tindarius DSM 2278 TaxID=1090322 RepID=W9DQN9_METTI|nr:MULTISPECIES: YhbY family RNA-binding protein [Methanolobus]ETA67680.1 putative RNA-binding protein containing KH domain, possibly ribosomal protein [Methanolobus tindarius DSM 2278]MDK2832759.1 RNA-binding protein [Methanolobus sp.]MDK2939038.1 RNA-binding protein [Methanolobus sp.]